MASTGNAATAPRAVLTLALLLLCAPALAAPLQDKDQSRLLPGTGEGKLENRLIPALPRQPDEETPRLPGAPLPEHPETPEAEDMDVPEAMPGDLELEALIAEDIPDIEAVDFSLEEARRALDVLEEVYGKLDDEEIEKYPTLQEFAEKSPQGARLREIAAKHGFASVGHWSRVITNIGFALTSLHEGDEELLRQLELIRADRRMDEERKRKLLKYYDALIPSDNNRQVIQRLYEDEAYRRKLELLEGHEE